MLIRLIKQTNRANIDKIKARYQPYFFDSLIAKPAIIENIKNKIETKLIVIKVISWIKGFTTSGKAPVNKLINQIDPTLKPNIPINIKPTDTILSSML